MEVAEALEKKRALERAILELIWKFQNQTGTRVDAVVLDKRITATAHAQVVGVIVQAQL